MAQRAFRLITTWVGLDSLVIPNSLTSAPILVTVLPPSEQHGFDTDAMGDKKKEHHLIEASAEGAEALLDYAITSEAIKAIPIAGTVIKMVKAYGDFRSAMLHKKLSRFLGEPSLLATVAAQKMHDEIFDDPKRMEEVGEMVLMMLDKATDLQKPTLYGQIMAAYLGGVIEGNVMFSLMHAIDVSFILDVATFIRTRGGDVDNETLWRERLGGTGLLMPYQGNTWKDEGISYGLAPLGDSLLAVVDYCQGISSRT
jgi:hypothetical protein